MWEYINTEKAVGNKMSLPPFLAIVFMGRHAASRRDDGARYCQCDAPCPSSKCYLSPAQPSYPCSEAKAIILLGLHTHAQKQRPSACTASQPSGEEGEMSVLERVDRGWNPTPTVDKAL